MPADRASKGASAALASLTLDLAECAAAGEGRVQQRTHTLPGGALLVLSIGCGCARGGGSGATLPALCSNMSCCCCCRAVQQSMHPLLAGCRCRASGGSAEVSQSSLASSAAAAGAAPAASDDDELPTRLSTDDEGERSRPMSRNDSRPGSRAAAAGLEAVPEESGRPASRLDGADSWHQRGVLGAGAAGSSFRQQREQASAMQPAAEVQPAPEEAAAAEVPSLHDADGILIDSADAEVSQEVRLLQGLAAGLLAEGGRRPPVLAWLDPGQPPGQPPVSLSLPPASVCAPVGQRQRAAQPGVCNGAG